MFTREKQMRPIVAAWVEKQGYYVAHEPMVGGSWCDLVGCKWSERIGRAIPLMTEAVAVELKLNDIAGVLYQAERNLQYGGVTKSYAAMPDARVAKMKESTIIKFQKIRCGLLSVSTEGVSAVIVAVGGRCYVGVDLARRLWRYKIRQERLSQLEKPDA